MPVALILILILMIILLVFLLPGIIGAPIGVEINPLLAIYTSLKLRRVKGAKIKCGDMYTFELPPETTVVYAYANNFTIPRLYKRVQKEAKRLNKTIYLISNAFDFKTIKAQKHLAPYYLYKIEP